MDENSNQRIGRNLRRIRELKQMTQAELAERMADRGIAGFYPQTITKIEAGSRSLKFEEALAACKVLGIRAEELDKFDDVAIRRWALSRDADLLVRATEEAVRVMVNFLNAAEGLTREIEAARAAGVSDHATLGWARAAAAITGEDVLSRAHAKIAGEIAQDEATQAGSSAFFVDRVIDFMAEEASRDGEHPEAL